MEKPGAIMLQPVYELLFDGHRLVLTEDQVAISYKTYKTSDEKDRQSVVDQKLAPGIKQCVTRHLKISV